MNLNRKSKISKYKVVITAITCGGLIAAPAIIVPLSSSFQSSAMKLMSVISAAARSTDQNRDLMVDLSKFLSTKYIAIKRDFFANIVKWDVTVNAIKFCDSVNYIFKYVNWKEPSRPSNPDIASSVEVTFDEQNLFFKNVSYDELSAFNTWLNRSEFEKFHDISVYSNWTNHSVAEIADTKNPILGISYDLEYIGDSWGMKDGIDVQILQPGTDLGRELSFGIDFKIQNADLMQKLFSEIIDNTFNKSLIFEYYGDDSTPAMTESSMLFKYTKTLMDVFIDDLWATEKSSIFNENRPIHKDKKGVNNWVYTLENQDIYNDFMWDIPSQENWQVPNWKIKWEFVDGKAVSFVI